MPGDITGSLVFDSRAGRALVPRGPCLHEPAARRRDQPHAPEDAVRAARGDGGTPGHHRRRDPPAARPFLVAATQNPVEYEGTYPLPEAQLDRFLLKVVLPLPERDAEIDIVERHASGFDPRDIAAAGVRAVAGPADLAAGRGRAYGEVQVSSEVAGYIVDVGRATRNSPSLSLGVVPRGATALLARRARGPGCRAARS